MALSKHAYRFAFITLFLVVINSVRGQSGIRPDSTKTKEESKTEEPKPPVLGNIFKPTIGLGVGNLSFFGDLYTKHFQSPTVSRLGYELYLSQPLTHYLHLSFYVMFGKLGADERTPTRNENFESTIRLGGVQLMYDFSNFIKKQKNIRPYILLGVEGFEFLTKTDLKDKYGNTYYYWSDGSIKNMPQGSPGSQNAINLVRDYTYETDVRELNRDGFGKYQERSWAIPVGVGFTMNLSDKLKFRFGATMHFTFTDYIDGITSKSVGNRKGNSANDKFMMMSASVHYNLVFKKQDAMLDTLGTDHFDEVDWLAIDKGDEDKDGVLDWDDYCHGTPAGVKVDSKGCPLDTDKDLIPDYRDDEPATPPTMIANGRGVGITDEMAQKWYDNFYDSTGTGEGARIVNLDSAKGKAKINSKLQPQIFTVELARYKGGIPSDEMAFLLSIGDVRSFNLGDETVVYAAGSYEDIRKAIVRRDEFRDEGLKSAKVGYFKGETYYSLTDDELQKEIAAAEKKYGNTTVANTTTVISKDQVVFRVQLGAYKSKLSAGMFKNVGDVIELKTEDGYYRYCSGAYSNLNAAAFHRAELVLEGYGDAFVTAYKNGKRISMTDAGATYEKKDKGYKEDLNEKVNVTSTVDKSNVSFRIQIGVLKKANDTAFEERISKLKGVSKQQTSGGLIRYMLGDFKNYNDAVKFKGTLVEEGFNDAFVIATFKGEIISIQEALELLK
ncbi:MAG TPA: hypothetical protein VNZ49_12460 [Bacteroidia bacterium]|jgi:hypothetical protein|nr:hypothetical protein [Bacteroidia bacterium]